MKEGEKILRLAELNHGMITNAMLSEYGIPRGSLKYLSDSGKIEKVSRGTYTLPEFWEDEFVSAQNRYKRGIFSLTTALFLCDLTDRTPAKFNMTFPSAYNLTSPKGEGIICNSCNETLYSLGVTELKTPGGHTVRGYSAERTLCDILKPRNHVDIQIVVDAFRQYTSSKNKNIPLLSEYGDILKVGKKLRSYLEVLL